MKAIGWGLIFPREENNKEEQEGGERGSIKDRSERKERGYSREKEGMETGGIVGSTDSHSNFATVQFHYASIGGSPSKTIGICS